MVGYLFYRANFYPGHQITEDYAYVYEFGFASKETLESRVASHRIGGSDSLSDKVALALLTSVSTRVLSSGKRELHLSIALDPTIRAAVTRLCENISENNSESAMGRVLNRETLVHSFLMEWNERWIAAGRPAGSLEFQSPYGATALKTSGQFLQIEETAETRSQVSQSQLLGLLFGAVAVSDLVIDSESKPLVEALFPAQSGIYWSADGF